MLSNIMALAKQGKVINCDFAAKTTTIDTVIKAWSQANKTDYVANAKGTYATYTNHNVCLVLTRVRKYLKFVPSIHS